MLTMTSLAGCLADPPSRAVWSSLRSSGQFWLIWNHVFSYWFLYFRIFKHQPQTKWFLEDNIFSSFKYFYFLNRTPPRSCLVLSYSYFKFKTNLACRKRVKHHSSIPLIMMLLLKQDVRGCRWAIFFFFSPPPPLRWDTPGRLMLKSAKDKPLSWLYIWDYVMKGLCNGCQPQKKSTGGWACAFWGLDKIFLNVSSFSSYIHTYVSRSL